MNLSFRELISEDIAECLSIVKEIYTEEKHKEAWDILPKDLSDVLNKVYPSKCLVALTDKQIVGFGCYVKVDPKISHSNIFYKLTWINIHPKKQKKGIGKKLVNELEKHIKEECKEYCSAILQTDKPEFYKKLGYEIYDKNEGNDCMQKVLNDIPLPRILVGTIFSDIKDYAIKDWFKNVCAFTYPGFDFCAIDNSKDKKYHKKIFKYFSDRKSKSNIKKLIVSHSPRIDHNSDVFMAFSANELRKYFLRGNYDAILYLECDIHPPVDIIERLLSYNKQIISAIYFTGDKRESYPMLADLEHSLNEDSRMRIKSYVEGFFNIEECCMPKESISNGLGCCLMHKSVLEKISFRYQPDHALHHDGTFAQDLMKNGIKNMYVPIICKHENQTWDIQQKMIASK